LYAQAGGFKALGTQPERVKPPLAQVILGPT
jgi:hypothetical protein